MTENAAAECGPLDPGLRNERTALAWQRTSLTVLAVSAGTARLTFEALGWLATTNVAFALALAIWMRAASKTQYRRTLMSGEGWRGGIDAMLLAMAILVLGLLAATVIIGGW